MQRMDFRRLDQGGELLQPILPTSRPLHHGIRKGNFQRHLLRRIQKAVTELYKCLVCFATTTRPPWDIYGTSMRHHCQSSFAVNRVLSNLLDLFDLSDQFAQLAQSPHHNKSHRIINFCAICLRISIILCTFVASFQKKTVKTLCLMKTKLCISVD